MVRSESFCFKCIKLWEKGRPALASNDCPGANECLSQARLCLTRLALRRETEVICSFYAVHPPLPRWMDWGCLAVSVRDAFVVVIRFPSDQLAVLFCCHEKAIRGTSDA